MKKVFASVKILMHVLPAAFYFFACTSEELHDGSQPPEENRFQKNVLLAGLDEPMELAVLPDGSVLFIERKGAIKLYQPKDGQAVQLARLNVFHDLEDGLLGLALDPDFRENEWIYLFYSPAGDAAIQRVSRFRLAGSRVFDEASEKILLEIPTQRAECCHSAGSLAFGPDKTLYIAVGNNTNPHNPGYYNSIDERAGREYWDAQRTAGNTDDFRGKILRIKPDDAGTYTIPDGNLFSKDGSQGKPEIYAMGCRNPYRITVDQKTGYLYWGDVGQNTEDNPARGPISYDEFHQAKGPGFFGWPYFAGDNKPYADFDFETEEIGPFFDVERPVNESRNNTGERVLPPAKPAFIWYSYDSSSHFNHLGTGGKSPITGPVYYSDHYEKKPDWVDKPRNFPAYFNGKLFIAEWMRDWINVVTMDAEGNLVKIEPFMSSSSFAHPIELEFGPDGALYILEYGTFWFSENKDAKLVRIDYHAGNRAPVAVIKAGGQTTGAAPMVVNFSAEDSYDYDLNDELEYTWILDAEKDVEVSGLTAQHNFTIPGRHKVALKVIDSHGESSTAEIEVQVGNDLAEILFETEGNKSFYKPEEPFTYTVTVNDSEDGSVGNGISTEKVSVTLHYLPKEEKIQSALQRDNLAPTNFFGGLELINQSDCKACHHQTETSVGPSYEKIAVRYQDQSEALNLLAEKIVEGGSGNWGETAMSAHPQLSEEEAREMVKYILSLAGDSNWKDQLPLQGSFIPKGDSTGNYLLHVAYEDRGGKVIGPLTSRKIFIIRNPTLNVVHCDDDSGVSKDNGELVRFTQSGAYIAWKNVDLSHLTHVTYAVSSAIEGTLSLHLDSLSGPVIGTAKFRPDKREEQTDATKKNIPANTTGSKLKPTAGMHDIFFVYRDAGDEKAQTWRTLDLWSIHFE